MGIMSADRDGNFNPRHHVTRAMLAAVLNRITERPPLEKHRLDSIVNPFNDVSVSHWAYKDIILAVMGGH